MIQESAIILSKTRTVQAVKNGHHPMISGVQCKADPVINMQIKDPQIQADKGFGTSCQI